MERDERLIVFQFSEELDLGFVFGCEVCRVEDVGFHCFIMLIRVISFGFLKEI